VVLFDKFFAKTKSLVSSCEIHEDASACSTINTTNSCCSVTSDNIDNSKRNFLFVSGCVIASVSSACAVMPLLASWMPTTKTKKLSRPLRVDLNGLQPGAMLTVEWNNQPIFIVRRTPQMLEELRQNISNLRDPESRVDQQPDYAKNIYRSLNPEYAVLVGLCTHLGCVPQYNSDTQNGFYCPCHGSSFDSAGRVFKNVPAPINLAVPPHHFIAENILVIGESV
jgi:ubiquinol-cytochrome c reductase iron-sulfur subunit